MSITPPPLARYAKLLALLSLLGLLLTYSANSLLLNHSAPNFTVWLIQIVPLAALLPGLLHNSVRTYQWLCFLVLIYFIVAVLAAFSPSTPWGGLPQLFFCVILFCSAIVFSNSYGKATGDRH